MRLTVQVLLSQSSRSTADPSFDVFCDVPLRQDQRKFVSQARDAQHDEYLPCPNVLRDARCRRLSVCRRCILRRC